MRWRRASFGLAFLAVAAVAVAVRAGDPAQPLAASTATVAPTPPPTATTTVAPTLTPETDPEPAPPPIPQVELGDFLEGGRTYALSGGAWIFDVPEGMRLWHNMHIPSDPPNGFGFMDRVTGSLITIYLRPDGSLDFYGFNHGSTPEARELADAWLPAIEASLRRPPGFVEPPPTPAPVVPGPGANPDGVPYLRGYGLHEEVFEGGRTYATPDDKWLVDVPTGISIRLGLVLVMAHTLRTPHPPATEAYKFSNDADTAEWIAVSKDRGRVVSIGGQPGRPDNTHLAMLAASFRRNSTPADTSTLVSALCCALLLGLNAARRSRRWRSARSRVP